MECSDAGIRLDRALRTLMRELAPVPDEDPLGHLSLAQLRVVRCLGEGSKTAGETAEDLGISMSGLSQLAAKLEELGLIERKESETDRRCKQLCLTGEGAAKLAERDRRRGLRANRLIDALSAAELEACLTALEKMAAREALYPDIIAKAGLHGTSERGRR